MVSQGWLVRDGWSGMILVVGDWWLFVVCVGILCVVSCDAWVIEIHTI